MDKLSHSQKNYNVNTMYDDVFGGPPKFGIPTRTTTTLSPRVDDYGEIFGGVHAPRATSIPVLDLPVVDEAEVFFDVRSSGFDYDEVFGEESNSDFAVSFEELIDQTNGRDHFSSDEAWTPEAEYLSEESDHSVKDGDSSSGDSPESVHGRTEFNISYHQVGQRGNENMENVITQVFQRTLPDCTSVVDHTESLQMMDGECSSLQQADDVCFGNSAFVSSERKKERDLRKTLSQPAHGGICEPQYLHVGRPHEGYVRSSSFPNESFFTISDVSLRTLPSQLPPPSRPPPPTALDARQGSYSKSTQDYKWFGSDGSASESSPPSFDEVVGASSYAQASAAAILEAMEKAEARMKSAKESMGRKNEVFYNHKNLFQKNKRENYYGKVTRSFDNHSITAETSQGTGERMGNQMAFYAFSENRKLNKEDAVISESLEGKRRQTVDKSSEDEKHGRESMSSQGPYKTDKAPQWKKETDLELVSTDKFGKLFDQKSNQENVTSILNSWNAMQKSGIKEPSTQNRHGKTYSVDQKSSGSDRTQTGFGDSRKCENIVEDHYQDSEVEDKKNRPKKEKPELKEAYRSMGHQKNFSFEYEDSDNRQRGSFEGEMEERQNPMHGQMEDERMLDDKIRQEKMENIEVSGWEENKEKTRQSYEENNQKKLKEIPLKQDGTEGVKESLFNKLEGKEKRLGKTCENTEEKMKKQGVPKPENEREEHENRFKKIPEREGNELRQKDLNSRIEKEMRGRGVFGKDFTEARIEESRREIGDELKEVNEYDRKSKSWQAVQQEEESEMGLQKNPDELGSTVEEIINLQETGNLFNNALESMKQKRPDDEGGDCSLSNEQSASGIHNGVGRPRVIGGTLVGDEQNALLETKKFPTERQNDNFEAAIRRSSKTKVENRNGSNMIPDVATQGKQPANEHLEEGQNIGQTHVYLNHGDKKGGVMSSRVVKASSEHIRNKESQAAKLEAKESSQQIPQPAFVDNSNERKVKSLNETSEGKEAEKIRREKELEQLRKMEEEIDREREREKDRMDFDRTELEARERVERAAVERAMNEARQRLEKTSVEARLKVERSAVERATAEARERVLEKIMAENASKERDRDHQYQSAGSFEGSRYASSFNSNGIEGESVQRCRARLERQRRTAERAEKALAEKTKRDLLAQKEQAERNRIAETLDAEVKRWSSGKEGNLRALLSTLQYILGPNSGWQPIPLTEVITSAAVKRAYRKAMLCVHPDKLLQKRASIQQKYICEKVFDLLKEAWNKFNAEER